ncbi:MAG: hypothetical protein Q9174_001162 [Haloplaca sp. 1 TL-2023]
MMSSKKPVDVASKEKNEYIPSFISKKPFYLEGPDPENDYLDHQRLQSATPDQSKWYDRGKRLGPAATKFRKGACENCGAMTHKTKECLNRPRAKGAKWTGKDIQADEVVQDVQLGWDAKRDRWNGYDAAEYKSIINEYEELEHLKKSAKGGQAAGQQLQIENADDENAPEQEEAKYAEESDMGRQQSTATRNLRLREDTAKYLLNLELDSAKYDPKTRSMVDMGAQADQAAALVAEDNFMRASGDAAEFERAQKYAWESQERGDKNKSHLQANPTSGEYFRRQERKESEAKKEAHRKRLREKYGGEQHIQPDARKVNAITESEKYVEYDVTGAIKDAGKTHSMSKYPENVLINNHTSVWGSWWHDFQWGYACCHSAVKNSYCTGEEGKAAMKQANRMRTGAELEGIDARHTTETATTMEEQPPNGGFSAEQRHPDTGRKPKALAKKRTLAEMRGGVGEQELEAYKRSRAIGEDPMGKFLGKDELVS